MKKLWRKFIDDVLPAILGGAILITTLALSVGAMIWSVKWVLRLVGVL